MKWKTSALVGLVAAFWTFAAGAAPVQVGWIESVEGDVSLHREGAAIDAAVLSPLHAGDVLAASDGEASLLLRVGEEMVTVTAANSPYRVPAAGEPSLVSSLVGRIAFLLEGGESERRTVGAISRGDGFGVAELGVLGPTAVRRDTFELRWQSEALPCTVALRDHFSRRTVLETTSAEPRLLLSLEAPWPSPLAIDLICGPSSVSYAVTLVDEGALPVPEAGVPDKAAEAAMYAFWLYTQEDGIWAWEALQQLREAAQAGDTLAAAILERLQTGS